MHSVIKIKWKIASSGEDVWSCLLQIKSTISAENVVNLIAQILPQFSGEISAIVKRTQREYIVDS